MPRTISVDDLYGDLYLKSLNLWYQIFRLCTFNIWSVCFYHVTRSKHVAPKTNPRFSVTDDIITTMKEGDRQRESTLPNIDIKHIPGEVA